MKKLLFFALIMSLDHLLANQGKSISATAEAGVVSSVRDLKGQSEQIPSKISTESESTQKIGTMIMGQRTYHLHQITRSTHSAFRFIFFTNSDYPMCDHTISYNHETGEMVTIVAPYDLKNHELFGVLFANLKLDARNRGLKRLFHSSHREESAAVHKLLGFYVTKDPSDPGSWWCSYNL